MVVFVFAVVFVFVFVVVLVLVVVLVVVLALESGCLLRLRLCLQESLQLRWKIATSR